jgi:hypothetical protein
MKPVNNDSYCVTYSLKKYYQTELIEINKNIISNGFYYIAAR